MNIDQLTVTKLSLSPGDVLAVAVPTMLNRTQRDAVTAHLVDGLHSGVQPMIFEGGITIAQIIAGGKA